MNNQLLPILAWTIAGVVVGCWQASAADEGRKRAYAEFATRHAGDAVAGEQLFRSHEQLNCSACHLITGVEKAGPNLDGVADKYTRSEMIRHVLEPAQAIKPGYEQISVTTTDGKALAGRLVRSTKEMVRVTDANGRSTDVLRSSIETMAASTSSLMPDNLVTSISFGEDHDGELFAIGYEGTLFQLDLSQVSYE